MFATQPSAIYLDHSATTPVLPEVVEAMRPFWSDNFGNPASAHSVGRKARQALEDARERVGNLLQAEPDEVIFTSGATEANNLAIFGLAGAHPAHVLASPIEHPSVIEPFRQLGLQGFEVEWLPVQIDGSVSVDALIQSIRLDTRLVSLMLVNHETGAVQPVHDAARKARAAGNRSVCFHCDAAQALGKLPFPGFNELGIDSLSASGHKFGAPKGIGILLLRRGSTLRPLLYGGHQQKERRPGTEPVALAVGLATALEIATTCREQSYSKSFHIRQRFLTRLRDGAGPLVVNGSDSGSPFLANVSFPGCRADLLLMKLDLLGVACSTGSACSSGSLLASPVLRFMGVPDELLKSAMRFSFSSCLSAGEIDEAGDRIIKAVNDLRSASVSEQL
jgi:cysteine desulfurase